MEESNYGERIVQWESGKNTLINLCNTMIKELTYFSDEEFSDSEQIALDKPSSDKVFIVHGHDEGMKSEVARVLDKLGLTPVILHEQEDHGLTVIEKFETNALQCQFAIVLLSPDDKGYSVSSGAENSKFRARQNVILELGYFIGALGRNRVLSLVKEDPAGNFEVPSDIAGVIYTPFDSNGGWRGKLFSALKSASYEVNANDLF
jgi:predicted nucleotide-binding protein